jgi:hypothetical protein
VSAEDLPCLPGINLGWDSQEMMHQRDDCSWCIASQHTARREVLEGSNELRLMVCREKITNGRKGTAVVAACGACFLF